MKRTRIDRRAFLKVAGAGAGAAAFPLTLRAQPKTIKIGVVSPVTGAMAEVGQDCRRGAQMAAEAINAAGGIKSLGGAKLELLLADSQMRVEVARAEAERLINSGAQLLTGAFHSAHVAAIAPLAQQRRVPYIIDITAADAPTANVAKSVREGLQKIQYVYRIFPSSDMFGRNAVRAHRVQDEVEVVVPVDEVVADARQDHGERDKRDREQEQAELRGRRASPEDAVTEHASQSADGVLPADLLSLLVRPAGVRDRHLVHSASHPRDLRRHLGLEAEPVLAQIERLKDLSPDHLVARPHVGQVQVREEVREMREDLVPERVFVEQDAMGFAEKPRSVDDVGAVTLDRIDQLAVLLRIVFEVGVLDDDDPPARELEPAADCGALAAVRRLEVNRDVLDGEAMAGLREGRRRETGRDAAGDLLEQFSCATRRTVIDDDELLVDLDLLDPPQGLLDHGALVVDGDDDGQRGRGRGVHGRRLAPREARSDVSSSSSAAVANAHMFFSRPPCRVSSVIARSTGPATARHAWPGASP